MCRLKMTLPSEDSSLSSSPHHSDFLFFFLGSRSDFESGSIQTSTVFLCSLPSVPFIGLSPFWNSKVQKHMTFAHHDRLYLLEFFILLQSQMQTEPDCKAEPVIAHTLCLLVSNTYRKNITYCILLSCKLFVCCVFLFVCFLIFNLVMLYSQKYVDTAAPSCFGVMVSSPSTLFSSEKPQSILRTIRHCIVSLDHFISILKHTRIYYIYPFSAASCCSRPRVLVRSQLPSGEGRLTRDGLLSITGHYNLLYCNIELSTFPDFSFLKPRRSLKKNLPEDQSIEKGAGGIIYMTIWQ